MLEPLFNLPTCWEKLQKAKKPVVLYGMGDGADRILSRFDQFGIPVADFFASEGFVRGQFFHGKRVKHLSEIEALYGDFIVVTAFATQDPAIMDRIYQLAQKYTVLAPDVPVAGETLFDRDFFRAHLKEFEAAYALLSDQRSRQIFYDLAAFKLTGELSYLKSTQSPGEEVFSSLLRLNKEEHYVDLGAYNGDTVEAFLSLTGGRFSSILALEPGEKNFRKLEQKIQEHGLAENANVKIYPLAAWEDKADLQMSGPSGRAAKVAESGRLTAADSVDNLLGKAPVSYLKMDVEGSEAMALLGAANAIRRHKPKLLISAYHRSEDLFALPLQLERICPGYRMYLRRFPYIPAWEINLVGVWEEEKA